MNKRYQGFQDLRVDHQSIFEGYTRIILRLLSASSIVKGDEGDLQKRKADTGYE
jgi:hypothetical protein